MPLAPADFLPASNPVALGDDEIHVWLFAHAGHTAGSAESPRVRHWLAAYAGGAVTITRDAHGKPHIRNSDLRFNLSHSGDALVLAIARGIEVGIDIEDRARTRRVDELAARFFHAREAAALRGLPDALRTLAFLRLWSHKEAVLKAKGRGLADGLHRTVFELTAAGEVAGFAADTEESGFRIQAFTPDERFVGALAWSAQNRHVKAFRHAETVTQPIATAARSG